MLGRGRLKEDNISLGIAYTANALVDDYQMCNIREPCLTKCYVSISHPSGNRERLVRNEPRNLITSHQIPHNGRLPSVIAHDKAASADFTLVVHCNQLDIVHMAGEPSVDGESIVVAAHY